MEAKTLLHKVERMHKLFQLVCFFKIIESD